jgi:pimeloyl-ACP methyl ester carboxylesterase
MVEVYDHNGDPVEHHRAYVNGVRLHYVTAGSGEPLLLLHGTPKTHYYYHKLIPLLTDEFEVVAPDLRGFGDSDRPSAKEGYDMMTNADDMAELMTEAGHDEFHIHAEDRGAEYAYALTASREERVKTLSFAEMLLAGQGLHRWSDLTKDNLEAQPPWTWHIPFFFLEDLPEMLIEGREKAFWNWWMKAETYNPHAIDDEAVEEWATKAAEPGGLRGIMETYRATFENQEITAELKEETTLELPILTTGAPEFYGHLVEDQMDQVSNGVDRHEVFERCGHSLSLEAEDRLAPVLREFMLEEN